MSDEATTRPPATPWSVGPGWPAMPVQPPPPPRPLTVPIADHAALQLVALAILGGAVAQGLFYGELLGVNLVACVGLVLVCAFVTRRRDVVVDRLDWWLPSACLAFAAFVAIRGDGALIVFDTLASLMLLFGSLVALRGVAITRGTWQTAAYVGAVAGAVVVGGAARLGGGFRPLRGLISRRSTAVRVVLGFLLALPLVLVFGALFSAADAVFATQLDSLLAIDLSLDEVVGRVIVGMVAGWLFAGALVVAWLADDRTAPRSGGPLPRRLGVLEASIALLAVDALFAVFVVLQAAYLFGGLDTLAVSGMTYSEYARRGFFELIAVAALAGVVLMTLDAVVDRRAIVFRWAGVALGLLTGAVLVSAVARLTLYQQAYGWTELRFYALLAIGWLGVGVLAVVAGLATDRLRFVPRVLLLAAVVLALGANVIGPQRFVTEQNVARVLDPSLVPADGWSGLDVDYLYSLGDEAVLPLIEALPRLPDGVQANVERALGEHADDLRYRTRGVGWPSFNLARARALDALAAAR